MMNKSRNHAFSERLEDPEELGAKSLSFLNEAFMLVSILSPAYPFSRPLSALAHRRRATSQPATPDTSPRGLR